MLNLNLLPWREQTRQLQQRRFNRWLFAGIFAAILAILSWQQYLTRLITDQARLNSNLNQRSQSLELKVNLIRQVKQQQQQLQIKLKDFLHLAAQRKQTTVLYETLVTIIPPMSYITHIKQIDDQVTMSGNTKYAANIALLMQNIMHSKQFGSPGLIAVNHDDTDAEFPLAFSLRFEILTSR